MDLVRSFWRSIKKEEISEFALKLMDEGVIHEKTYNIGGIANLISNFKGALGERFLYID